MGAWGGRNRCLWTWGGGAEGEEATPGWHSGHPAIGQKTQGLPVGPAMGRTRWLAAHRVSHPTPPHPGLHAGPPSRLPSRPPRLPLHLPSPGRGRVPLDARRSGVGPRRPLCFPLLHLPGTTVGPCAPMCAQDPRARAVRSAAQRRRSQPAGAGLGRGREAARALEGGKGQRAPPRDRTQAWRRLARLAHAQDTPPPPPPPAPQEGGRGGGGAGQRRQLAPGSSSSPAREHGHAMGGPHTHTRATPRARGHGGDTVRPGHSGLGLWEVGMEARMWGGGGTGRWALWRWWWWWWWVMCGAGTAEGRGDAEGPRQAPETKSVGTRPGGRARPAAPRGGARASSRARGPRRRAGASRRPVSPAARRAGVG